jgi:hypothetical protein
MDLPIESQIKPESVVHTIQPYRLSTPAIPGGRVEYRECFLSLPDTTRGLRHGLPENWRIIQGKQAACRVISAAYLIADDIHERD